MNGSYGIHSHPSSLSPNFFISSTIHIASSNVSNLSKINIFQFIHAEKMFHASLGCSPDGIENIKTSILAFEIIYAWLHEILDIFI